jgi:hypothetical protein
MHQLATLAAILLLMPSSPSIKSIDLLHDPWPALRHRLPADRPDRRCGHAGRHLDAEQLFGLGRGGDGLHAPQQRDDHHRRAGRQLGAILSYIMCRAMNRSFISVIAGGFGAVRAPGGGGDRPALQARSAEDAAFLMGQADR